MKPQKVLPFVALLLTLFGLYTSAGQQENSEKLKEFLGSPDRIERIVYRRTVHGAPPIQDPVTSQMVNVNDLWSYTEGGWCNGSLYLCSLDSFDDDVRKHIGRDQQGLSGMTDNLMWRISGLDLMEHKFTNDVTIQEAVLSRGDYTSPVKLSLQNHSYQLFEVLNLGIPYVKPRSFTWRGDEFAAVWQARLRDATGEVTGRIVRGAEGRPVGVLATNHFYHVVFSNAFEYVSNASLPFGFPNRILVSQLVLPVNGAQAVEISKETVEIEVHELREASDVAVQKFTPVYFLPAPERTGFYSNQMFYWNTTNGPVMAGDRLAYSKNPQPIASGNWHKRTIIICFFLLSAIWLGFLAKKSATKKTT